MDISRAVKLGKHRAKRKRVGRGEGSGRGKTSGRGHKGQKSRSGVSLKPLAEGGQRPLFRRLPKRGFNNKRFARRWAIVNVRDLNRFEEGSRVDEAALREAGLVSGPKAPVKVLGKGEIERKLTVVAARFSAGARAKIEAAGGTPEVAR